MQPQKAEKSLVPHLYDDCLDGAAGVGCYVSVRVHDGDSAVNDSEGRDSAARPPVTSEAAHDVDVVPIWNSFEVVYGTNCWGCCDFEVEPEADSEADLEAEVVVGCILA